MMLLLSSIIVDTVVRVLVLGEGEVGPVGDAEDQQGREHFSAFFL